MEIHYENSNIKGKKEKQIKKDNKIYSNNIKTLKELLNNLH